MIDPVMTFLGAAQADVGVLVISARKGEFETGFEKGGQTREHALLARTLGVAHLVVVINKMDDPTVNWEQSRYEECVSKLKPYLKQVGYTIKKDVKFLPISALSGANVRDEVAEDKCKWWKECYTSGAHNTSTPTLISTLNALTIEGRNAEGPLRVPCLDRYFERGTVVLGKVESGTLRVGDEVTIMPTRKKAKVDEVVIGESKVRAAKPGENVLFKLNQVGPEDIQKGYVICTAPRLCPAVLDIKVQLALVEMLEHRPVFTPGYEAVMHIHTVEIEVTCVRLLSVMVNGKALARPYARNGQICTARLSMPLHTCMEVFDRMPALGRVTLRDEGRTIAIGKILELYRDKPAVAAAPK
jgi:peptide chain release factor subunit 3